MRLGALWVSSLILCGCGSSSADDGSPSGVGGAGGTSDSGSDSPADTTPGDGAPGDSSVDTGTDAVADGGACDFGADSGEIPTWDPQSYAWPMYGHDVRRTSRSSFQGPKTWTPGSSKNWRYLATSQASLNIQAVVTSDGVYFGGWGILRREANAPLDTTIKFDGKWFGLALDGTAGAATTLFPPFDPHPVQGCYTDPSRSHTATDTVYCGDAPDTHTLFYNGTIEGTALVDPDNGTQYVGRGDGRFYAIDAAGGTVKWEVVTRNPLVPTDPDGGGEIPGGAVMGPGKIKLTGPRLRLAPTAPSISGARPASTRSPTA